MNTKKNAQGLWAKRLWVKRPLEYNRNASIDKVLVHDLSYRLICISLGDSRGRFWAFSFKNIENKKQISNTQLTFQRIIKLSGAKICSVSRIFVKITAKFQGHLSI